MYRNSKRITPLLSLLVVGGFTVTYYLQLQAQQTAFQKQKDRFFYRSHEIISHIQQHVSIYETHLLGIKGLFIASNAVSRQEFHDFISLPQLQLHYPGITAVGFAPKVPIEKTNEYVQQLHKDGFGNFQIKTDVERNLYAPVIYIEPYTGINLSTFGIDMYANPVFRTSMEYACDFDTTVISGKINLAPTSQQPSQTGFQMYTPIYRNGLPHNSLVERRTNLAGWVFATLSMNNFLRNVFDEQANGIQIEIFDGSETIAANQLFQYTNDPQTQSPSDDAHIVNQPIHIFDHLWTIRLQALADFDDAIDSQPVMLIRIIGISTTSLLAVLFWLMGNARNNALGLAKAMTQELQKNETRWEFAIEGAGDGMWDWDMTTNSVFCSDSYNELLGLTGAEVYRTVSDWEKRIHTNDKPSVIAALHAYVEGKSPIYHCEYRIQCKDQQWKWVLDRGTAIHFCKNGKPSRLIGTLSDITERKELDQQLRDKDLFNISVLDSLQAHIAVLDAQGFIISVNQAWREFAAANGGQAIDFIGVNYFSICRSAEVSEYHQEASEIYKAISDVLQGQKTHFNSEYPCQTPTETLWFQLNITPLQSALGGVVISYKNITASKRAELEQQESEHRFRRLADAAPVLIWLANTDKLCIWFNQVWLDFTGQTQEHEHGNGWLEGVHPEDYQQCLDTYIQSFDRREPFQMEYRLKRHDGEYRWLLDTGTPIYQPNGDFAGYIGSCVDISDIRYAKQQVEQTNTLFHSLLRQIPGVVYQYQVYPNGRSCFPFASEAIWDIYEVTPEQVRLDASQVLARIHPADYSKVVESIRVSIETLQVWQMEYRVVLPEKGLRWLSGFASPEQLADGSVLWHGFISDITEQIAMRREGQQSKEMLGTMLSMTTDFAIIASDDQGLITVYNRGAEKLYGYSADEMIGKRTPAILHDLEEISQCANELTLQLGRTVHDFEVFVELASRPINPSREWTIIRKDGTTLQISLVITVIRNDKQEITGLVGIANDISQRKQAEDERNRLLNIIDDATDFIALGTLQAEPLYINQHGLEMVGLPNSINVNNLNFKDFHSESAAKRMLEEIIPLVLQHGSWQGENVLLHKDGSEIPVAQSLLLHRDRSGAPSYLSTIMRDITLEKQTREALQKAKQAAEDLAQSKSDFLAKMSHEIRTPMNAIMGLSQLALNHELSEQIQDYLQKIYYSSTNLLDILNDILDFSKLDAKSLTLNRYDFNLDELIHNLEALFTHTTVQKGIEYHNDIANDIPKHLNGDAQRLQQILVNLLGNAIKFTERGSVTLTIRLLSVQAPQITLLFSVRDTGIGILAADQQKLFQAFSQVDNSNTRQFGGTGLGLAISQHLLQLMGSEFVLESSHGVGSTFQFELTLGIAAPIDKPANHKAFVADPLLLQGKRVLVAEDNMINQLVVREFLKLSGFVVTIVNNGQEALNQLASDEFDVVLMDAHMPVMDGFEATALIRSQPRFANLPIIALTAGVTQDEREQCLNCGMNDFVAKPIVPETLLATLSHWLNVVRT